MGLLDRMRGNASEIEVSEIQEDFSQVSQVLSGEERIEKAYRLLRNLFVFTNKRLILVDKQGFTGNEVEYHPLPYRSITHFSVETAGHFDLDAELKIRISGNPMPIQKRFNKNLSIYEVQSVRAGYVLG